MSLGKNKKQLKVVFQWRKFYSHTGVVRDLLDTSGADHAHLGVITGVYLSGWDLGLRGRQALSQGSCSGRAAELGGSECRSECGSWVIGFPYTRFLPNKIDLLYPNPVYHNLCLIPTHKAIKIQTTQILQMILSSVFSLC